MGTTEPAKPQRSLGRILLDMFLVLRSKRFTLFLLASSGFAFLYNQVYNVMPLYLEMGLEQKPPVDICTMANPFTLVFFQPVITKMFGKLKPIFSIVIGAVLIGTSMVISIVMRKNAVKNADGLLDLDTTYAAMGWGLLMAVGFASAAFMRWYNRWLTKTPLPATEEAAPAAA